MAMTKSLNRSLALCLNAYLLNGLSFHNVFFSGHIIVSLLENIHWPALFLLTAHKKIFIIYSIPIKIIDFIWSNWKRHRQINVNRSSVRTYSMSHVIVFIRLKKELHTFGLVTSQYFVWRCLNFQSLIEIPNIL